MTDKYDAKAEEMSRGIFLDEWSAGYRSLITDLAAALRSAAAEEREACAEIVDQQCGIWRDSVTIAGIATAIRSRGDRNLVQSDDVPAGGQCDHLMWKPIATAPKDGTPILWHAGKEYAVIFWPIYEACFDSGFWMPLPAPPSGDSTGSQDDQRLIEANGGQP